MGSTESTNNTTVKVTQQSKEEDEEVPDGYFGVRLVRRRYISHVSAHSYINLRSQLISVMLLYELIL